MYMPGAGRWAGRQVMVHVYICLGQVGGLVDS